MEREPVFFYSNLNEVRKAMVDQSRKPVVFHEFAHARGVIFVNAHLGEVNVNYQGDGIEGFTSFATNSPHKQATIAEASAGHPGRAGDKAAVARLEWATGGAVNRNSARHAAEGTQSGIDPEQENLAAEIMLVDYGGRLLGQGQFSQIQHQANYELRQIRREEKLRKTMQVFKEEPKFMGVIKVDQAHGELIIGIKDFSMEEEKKQAVEAAELIIDQNQHSPTASELNIAY